MPSWSRGTSLGDAGGGLVVWEVATQRSRLLRGAGEARGGFVAWSPRGDRVALAGSGDVLLGDPERGTVEAIGFSAENALGIAFFGWTVAIAYPGVVRGYDVATHETWSRPIEALQLQVIDGALAIATPDAVVTLPDTVPYDRAGFLAWLITSDRARRPWNAK